MKHRTLCMLPSLLSPCQVIMRRMLAIPVLALVVCFSFSFPSEVTAGPLSMRWQLIQNDVEPGVAESAIWLTNNSTDTLTSSGDWMIGFCQMSVHPYRFEGELLHETEVCATYHTLRPTADFLPLPPGATYEYRLLQKGSILRESNGPQGAFFIAHEGAEAQDITIVTERFTSPLQWTRDANPGYADGEWVYRYNEPFCKAVAATDPFDPSAPLWQRTLNIVPEPKEVTVLKGGANLNASIKQKFNKKIPSEGYRLTLGQKKITIEYSDESGLYYGQQSLERLRENKQSLPAMCINDYPDMPHRGLMLDIARNFTPKDEILRLLDVMSLYKLNIFHFHLVDDEAWRLEIPGLPELTDVGSRRGYTTDEQTCLYPAYCGGSDPSAPTTANGFLTRQDYIDIVSYAQERHITVIPEIDMPGHSRAAIRAMEARYKNLLPESVEQAEEYRLADPDDTSEYTSAQYYTDNVICIARPSCYNFVKKVITELSLMHEEAGQPLRIFHAGGDEVAKGAWSGSPICQTFMEEHGMTDTHELKDYFLQQVIEILTPMNIQIAGWEEIAMRGGEINPRFADKNVLSWCWNSIPEWRGDEKAYKLANAGYPVILACVGNLYLDMCYTNHQEERALHWGGYTDEHSTFDFLPYDIYRSVRYNMKREPRDIDEYDKQKKIRLRPEARKNIRGMQGQVFAETIRSAQQVEEYVFPKLIGLAERAWNATPISYLKATSTSEGRKMFEQERLYFSHQLYSYELPRLDAKGIHFHLCQPGIRIQNEQVGGNFGSMPRSGSTRQVGNTRHPVNAHHGKIERLVYINHPIRGAIIRYTTDGSEPDTKSPVYQAPFPLTMPEKDGADNETQQITIRAKAYYLGTASATTILIVE